MNSNEEILKPILHSNFELSELLDQAKNQFESDKYLKLVSSEPFQIQELEIKKKENVHYQEEQSKLAQEVIEYEEEVKKAKEEIKELKQDPSFES